MIAWNVYLKNKCIDTVYYLSSCSADYVRESLIDHDGYNPNIVIRQK